MASPPSLSSSSSPLRGFCCTDSGGSIVNNATAPTTKESAKKALYAAVRCAGRWGEIVRLTVTFRRAEAEAAAALAIKRAEAEEARDRLQRLLEQLLTADRKAAAELDVS